MLFAMQTIVQAQQKIHVKRFMCYRWRAVGIGTSSYISHTHVTTMQRVAFHVIFRWERAKSGFIWQISINFPSKTIQIYRAFSCSLNLPHEQRYISVEHVKRSFFCGLSTQSIQIITVELFSSTIPYCIGSPEQSTFRSSFRCWHLQSKILSLRIACDYTMREDKNITLSPLNQYLVGTHIKWLFLLSKQ